MATLKTTDVTINSTGDIIVIPKDITLNSNLLTTSEENGYTLKPLTSFFFERALDTRFNHLPRTTQYKHNKYKKRSFKIKPYNSMVFKDIPFAISTN